MSNEQQVISMFIYDRVALDHTAVHLRPRHARILFVASRDGEMVVASRGLRGQKEVRSVSARSPYVHNTRAGKAAVQHAAAYAFSLYSENGSLQSATKKAPRDSSLCSAFRCNLQSLHLIAAHSMTDP